MPRRQYYEKIVTSHAPFFKSFRRVELMLNVVNVRPDLAETESPITQTPDPRRQDMSGPGPR